MDKSILILIDEYRENFINLINNSQLPFWLILMITEPFLNQMGQVVNQQKENEKKEYEEFLLKKQNEQKIQNS